MSMENILNNQTNSGEVNFTGLKINGFLMIFANLLLIAISVALLFFIKQIGEWIIALSVVGLIKSLFVWFGFMQLEPNEARVMVFFGKYKGTFKETGFFWVNPFMTKKSISLRARNLDVKPIKVNDKVGNPIMIGLVMVWRVKDTYKCMFEIDAQNMAITAPPVVPNTPGAAVSNRMSAFENFVKVQSDAALRQVAGQYPYDDNETHDNEITLRGGGDEVNLRLVSELNNRLAMAGMEISEARINYLAYAPEIAAVMLRRQQASAVIAAREKIVEGAVSMVKMAIDKLESEQIAKFDKDEKARMISNLLVVLCADEAAQPIVNTGS